VRYTLRAMSELTLEIVEGPDAGKTARLAGTIEIGRDPAAGLPLRDTQASRRHARISAQAGGAILEDLDSSNGTFVNHQEVVVPTLVTAGDELLIGTSVIQLRSPAQIAIQASAVRQVPPALAIAERRPTFVDPADEKAAAKVAAAKATANKPVNKELDRLKDARTKAQARLAPFAIFILVVLVVAIYLGTQSN
jgi:pSer/pThr/pTyr-binding forkhead associated (FHA) protein